MFPEFAGADLYEFPLLCWVGARIAALNLQLNNRLDDGSVIYTVTPESHLVLEPFRLVSVTEAVEAATCIRSADLRYRVGPEEPFWMAKGRLVHTLFDHLLHNQGAPCKSIFREAYQEALPALMAVLPGSKVFPDEKEFEEEARTHFNNLKSWLRAEGKGFSLVGVEKDRMSTRWGLKGRADAIFYNGDRTAILELKSGKMPAKDHRVQLQAYSLLFTSDADNSAPDGYLLYSASGRVEGLNGRDNGIERTLLHARNLVVALKYSYTLEVTDSVEYNCPRNGRCFSRSACTRLFGDLAHDDEPFLNGANRQYYDRWLRLLSRDAWAEEGEFARVLDARTLKERVEESITFPVLEISLLDGSKEPTAKSNRGKEPPREPGAEGPADAVPSRAGKATPGQVVAVLSFEDSAADIGPGEEVIIHSGDACSSDAIRGRVIDSELRQTLVRLKVPFAPFSASPPTASQYPAFETSRTWFVDRIPFSRGREVSRQALFRFFEKADPAVIEAIVSPQQQAPSVTMAGPWLEMSDATRNGGDRPKESTAIDPSQPPDQSELPQNELNEDQQAATKSALDCETFHLIHGPPGTGKTRVLAQLIRICLDRGESVLVACPTNVALDRLLISVMNLGVRDFLRIGSGPSLSKEFLDAMELGGNPPFLLGTLAARERDFKRFRQRVEETKLIGATAYQCLAHPFFLRRRFDRVVVDEAGQLDEPATLGPLTFGRKFILGGDHLQLPPVVKTPKQNRDASEENGLEQSLFERLFLSSHPSRVSCLRMQYRMNREVQAISSQLFYGGTLFPSPETVGRRLKIDRQVSGDSNIEEIVAPERPVVFADVLSSDTGKASSEEAAVVCKIVERLLAGGVPSHEIGVITPYKAQQALIRRQLLDGRGNLHSLSVDTVDRFQGGEREVIILSLARSDAVTSFLADPKRLNVSLSRARSKLILLGHGRMLEEHPLFSSILDCAERITVTEPR